MTDHLQTRIENRIGILTLNRPQALNSLTLDMIRAITAALLAWRDDPSIDAVLLDSSSDKAFCAGGDIRFFYQMGQQTPQQGSALLEDFFTEEYALNYLVHHYPKPYLCLMDGIVMGGGMGIAQCFSAKRIRIVTERTKMAMPEVNIGLFPDVGGSFFLSRCPGQTGAWLALTGNAIGAADALYAGLADVFIPSAELAELKRFLLAAPHQDIAALVRDFAAPFAPTQTSELAKHQPTIDRHFGLHDVGSIMHSLGEDSAPFAQSSLAALRKRSPLMMSVALRAQRLGATMGIGDCLRMERSMVRHSFTLGEALEGIRATVIDKDGKPAWSPANLEEVSAAMVDGFFQSAWPAHMHPLRSWL